MKKTAYIAALLLAVAAWAGPAAAAEETAPAPAQTGAAALSVLSEELDGAASAGVIGEVPEGFLTAADLGDGMSYHPLDLAAVLPEAAETPMMVGQLRTERDGITQTADVLNLEGRSPEMDALFSGLFGADGKTVTPEGVQKIAAFNHMLGNAGAMLNQVILESIAETRRETGEPMPYSILHTELRSVETLHLMRDTGDALVYTTGGRVLLYVDGWVFPQYVRAYLWKSGDRYRLIAVSANDSQKDAAQEAGDRLVRRCVQTAG